MTAEEKEFHGKTRMEQLWIAEQHIKHLEAQLADQPKPATGELSQKERFNMGLKETLAWTERQLNAERDVVRVLRSKDNHWRESNAKLIEKYEDAGLEISELHKQLAAEREKVTAQQIANDMLTAQRNDLRKQLAAEREQLATVRELRELDQKALAAEREKVQTLTDALNRFGTYIDLHHAKDAPEKVK